jgi:DNA recombination protein RmuC
MMEPLILLLVLLAAVGGLAAWIAARLAALERRAAEQGAQLSQALEEKHRAMLKDLHEGLARQGDRLGDALSRSSGELRSVVEGRLDQIGGRVAERLDEGFRRTNETFTSVMARLAAIDEAQKKLDGLTSNVVTLQELLGDKRSRGAFGEVQLEALVRNILPPQAWAMQFTLPNGARADCVLRLPEPTGMVAVDSKFPLENYHRMLEPGLPEPERAAAQRQFRADVRRHVDDIAQKYIIPGVTSDGAVMFVPAEAVFAEIHAYHSELVDYAMQKRVWIVSPTTLMAVLNTARAVIKDVETRRQVHIIKDELGKLGREFARFDERMRKLADHIRQAHEDAEKVHVTSQKISQRFAEIESVELGEPRETAVRLVEVKKAD